MLQLNDHNFDQVIGGVEVVLVNFYADWCRFSQMLAPVFDQTAALIGDRSAVR